MTTLFSQSQAQDALAAINAQVGSSAAVSYLLVFGSFAAGRASAEDLDVIAVVDRRHDESLRYSRAFVGHVPVDLNVMSQRELVESLADREWQYRIATAVVALPGSASLEAATRWVESAQELLYRPEARLRRIQDCVSRLRVLLQLAGGTLGPGVRSHTAAEALLMSLELLVELSGALPYTGENLWSDALSTAGAERWRNATAFRRDGASPKEGVYRDWWRLKRLIKAGRMACETVAGARVGERLDRIGLPASELIGANDLLGALYRESGWGATNDALLLHLADYLVPAGEAVLARRQQHDGLRSVARIGRRRERANVGPRVDNVDLAQRRAKVILATGGCRVPVCSFCALPDMAHSPDWEANIDALRRLPLGLDEIAVYSDGSFFDEREVPAETRTAIAQHVRALGCRTMQVESLPRFLTADRVDEVRAVLGPGIELTVAIGLQSANPEIRRHLTGTPIVAGELEVVASIAAIRRRFAGLPCVPSRLWLC